MVSSQRTLQLSLLLITVLASPVLMAQYVVTHTDVAGPAGYPLTAQAILDASDNPPIAGWSIACCYDETQITITDLPMGADCQALNEGDGPDFYAANFSGADAGWSIGVVVSFIGYDELAPEDGLELHVPVYVFGVDAGTGEFCFCNAPLCVETVIVDTLGTGYDPEMVCGSYDISPGPLFRRGDVNDDGVFGLADCIQMLNFMFAPGSSAPCPLSLDANDDDIIGLADPIYGLNALFTNGPEIPPPLVDCGVDPSLSDLPCDVLPTCP